MENQKCAVEKSNNNSVTKGGKKKETTETIVKQKKNGCHSNNKNSLNSIKTSKSKEQQIKNKQAAEKNAKKKISSTGRIVTEEKIKSKSKQTAVGRTSKYEQSHEYQESMEHHIDTVYRIDTKISTDQHIPVVTGVVCIENSWVAVADSRNNNIKLFSTDGIILKEFKAENPSYLTFCAEMLVWSSGHGNQVELQSVDNEHSYEIHLDNPDILLSHPVAKGKGNKLIIANGDHICTFTVRNDKCNEGEEVVPRVSKVRPYMTNMMSVSELHRGWGYVFTDWQQRAVVFVDQDGVLQGMYTEEKQTNRTQFLPMGLHVHKPSMTVFVLDHLGSRLLLLDFYGSLIWEWKTAIENPWCISGNDRCEIFIAGNDRYLHVCEHSPF